MAYDTYELKKRALEVTEERKLIFIEDIAVFMGISKQTFYDHNLDEFDELKQLIIKNRSSIKNILRSKWLQNDNATTDIVLYKLCATDEELKVLNPPQRNENVNLNVNVDGDFSQLSENDKQAKLEHLRRCLE
jgi:hypothetical protein